MNGYWQKSMDEMKLGAIVLGAGLSRRMGKPKLLLPWGSTTVIQQVVGNILAAGVARVVVVTGKSHFEVSALFKGPVSECAYNADYENESMVTSFQVGLNRLIEFGCNSALLALGDQPQIQIPVVEQVIRGGKEHPDRLVVPSVQMRRGHPWIIPQNLWQSILALPASVTMRDFLRNQADLITYVNVETTSILADLDTPEDYARDKPE